MAAVVAAPACENDMNATNVGPTNPLLDGACDDDDNELTAEQKKIIEDRLKALQARFQAFEEKTTQQKIDELIMANEAYGLTQEEAEMVLRVCNNNEFEASDRLTEEEDGSTFLNAIRSMVGQEKRASRLTGRKRQAEEEQLARRTKILRRRRDQVDVDPEASDFEEEENWDEDDPSLWEDYADEPVQEMSHGVHFVRHAKTHRPAGGRLRLDDAIAAMQKREQMLKEKKEKETAEGKSESEASPDKAEKSESESEPSPDEPAEKPADEEAKPTDEAGAEGADAAPEQEAELDPLDELIKGWSEARIKAWNNRERNENQYYYRFNAPGESQGEGKWSEQEHALFMATMESVKNGELKDAAGNVVPMYQWGSFSKAIPGRVGYQCSNYYRSLITQNKLEDENYQLDDQGKLRFNFKNKGFTRDEDGRMKKAPAVPKAPRVPKAPKAPKDNTKALEKKRAAEAKKKAKAEAKAARDAEKEDKTFRSSCKFDTIRRSGRANGTKKYSDGDASEDEEDLGPVLPGFMDPLTRMPIEEPAISPYGHVCGYEIWCKILRQEGTKDTCPFTRQPLKRRQLVILTHDNITEYREKMVETQNN